MTTGRRELQFGSIDEIMPEVERLLRGYTTVGNWSLAQSCNHLATSMRRSVDLPATANQDASLWAPEERKREILAAGKLPEGIQTLEILTPPPGLDDREEAERLREAIAYFRASGGPVAPHRVLGPLTKEEWDRAQCIHCAHHLSFAIPKEG